MPSNKEDQQQQQQQIIEKQHGAFRVSSMLHVCSQIRQEASETFYSHNTFVIPWGFPNLGCRWLDSLSTANRRCLRHVRFCYGDGAFWTVYDAKIALSSLEMSLMKSGAWADLQHLKLCVPVCEFSVHTWRELQERKDALWVSVDETRPITPERLVSK